MFCISLVLLSLQWTATLACSIPIHRRGTNSTNDPFASQLVAKGIDALGGRQSLESLKGITFNAGLYRTQGLMQSYTPGYADQSISTTGSQAVSYSFSGNSTDLFQRIDRTFNVDQYSIYLRPLLQPYDVSIVTHTGANGFSCYVKGNENVALPADAVWGYTDDALFTLFQREALRFSPKLLLAAEQDSGLTSKNVTHRGHAYPSIISPQLGFTVLFDPDTFLPYIIRASEYHQIFGQSTSDVLLYNYTTIDGLNLPQRYKLAYNQAGALIDTLFYNITVNPDFSYGFFDGVSTDKVNQTVTQLLPGSGSSVNSSVYGTAEVFEFSSNTLWEGGYLGRLSNITVSNPVASLPDLYHLIFNDSPGYSTIIAVTEDAIMVTDAPPHQSLLVIQWIENTFNRTPTHLLVTHHHSDHNYGAADYVNVGATLVVPEDFTEYWKAIPNVRFETVSKSQPFIHRSKSMQIRGIWPGNMDVHSLDWMYFVFSEACPGDNSSLALAEGDAWDVDVTPGNLLDQRLATQFLRILESAGMPHDFVVLPIHGPPANITDLYALTDYDYPDYQVHDFKPGGAWC